MFKDIKTEIFKNQNEVDEFIEKILSSIPNEAKEKIIEEYKTTVSASKFNQIRDKLLNNDLVSREVFGLSKKKTYKKLTPQQEFQKEKAAQRKELEIE